ncbi:MAG: aminodeoxychorismate lyase [Frankiales bacterium]|nr:aminodeoxychorismate lyase [Frankiales bacterium]
MLEQPTRPAPKRLPKPVGLAVVGVVVLALLAGIGLGGRALYRSFSGPADYSGTGSGQVVVQIKTGDTAAQIGTTLVHEGVVKSIAAFTDAAIKEPKSRSLQPGYYGLRRKMSAASALALLLDPASRVKGRVTLPEGIGLAKVVDRLVQFTDLKRADILAALNNPAVLGLPAYAKGRVEGFLFPSTYDVDAKAGAVAALGQMTERFAEQAAALDLENGARDLGLTPYQLVTIASIVEAESPLDEDRAKVARVILNRLAKNMLLQVDSTINYIKAERSAHLSLDDISVDSPYNSYKHKGLPPTPIDSPGAKAIESTLAPATGDWLYFVKVDKAGHSFFTSDYDEFLRVKAKSHADGVF